MSENRNRSLFWPVVLITVGLLWLLRNLNVFPALDFTLLFDLWPLILVVVGINLIIGPRLGWLRALVAVAAVVLAVGYVVLAPALGISSAAVVQHAERSEPIGDAASARLDLHSSLGQTTIQALNDSTNLFEAEINYFGELRYEVEGTVEKTITLRVDDHSPNPDLFNQFLDDADLDWFIGLTTAVPLQIEYSAGVGDVELDLSGLALTALGVDGGVGKVHIVLPATGDFYEVHINAGVGEFSVEIEEGANLELVLDGGIGEFRVEVPVGAAMRLEANPGIGSVSVPEWLRQASGGPGSAGANGVWETEDFESAESRILIRYDGGIGGLVVR